MECESTFPLFCKTIFNHFFRAWLLAAIWKTIAQNHSVVVCMSASTKPFSAIWLGTIGTIISKQCIQVEISINHKPAKPHADSHAYHNVYIPECNEGKRNRSRSPNHTLA